MLLAMSITNKKICRFRILENIDECILNFFQTHFWNQALLMMFSFEYFQELFFNLPEITGSIPLASCTIFCKKLCRFRILENIDDRILHFIFPTEFFFSDAFLKSDPFNDVFIWIFSGIIF